MYGSLMVQKAQGENITVLLFLFLLLHFIAESKHFPCIALLLPQGCKPVLALGGLSEA